jgi:predicted transcriptional regulator
MCPNIKKWFDEKVIAGSFFVNGQLPEIGIVMSIRAKYARMILSGEKKVEVRRMFSKKWKGSKVTIYASGCEGSLVGEALIKDVVCDKPENVWERFSDQIGCTKEEFDKYTSSKIKVYAIVLEDAVPYLKSISIGEISDLMKENLRPPQNYYNLKNNTKWAEVVSKGVLLQGSLGG